MTWSRWARTAAYTVALAALGWEGAGAFLTRSWAQAAILYTLAFLLASLLREEWSTAAAYVDAVEARLPTRPTSRAHARLLARRVLAHTCGCDRWWTSLGTAHDRWCHAQTGAAPRARTHHPRRRPVPGRRAVATARRHRRHRPQ